MSVGHDVSVIQQLIRREGDDVLFQNQLTLGGVAGLVVAGEPAQVKVLDPGHPPLVLLVVDLPPVLAPGLLLLVLLGELRGCWVLDVGHFGFWSRSIGTAGPSVMIRRKSKSRSRYPEVSLEMVSAGASSDRSRS